MKYLIIIYLALGFLLSLSIGLEYNCNGKEMFPTYYASPFIFKQKSLGSSMEYFYSISGLVLNMLIWGVFLFFIDKIFNRFININSIKYFYKGIIVVFLLFTSLIVYLEFSITGRGFNEYSNYWYWNVDKEAKKWGVKCEGKIIFLNYKINL